jgi:alanine racemase
VKAAGIECKFHAANSAATLAYPDARLDMVRPGTLLYGENLAGIIAPFGLQEGFAWYARVVSVRDVGPGESVGYGGEWKARERTRIATLPVGYSDGLTVQPLSRSETVGEAMRMAGGITLLALGRRPSQRIVHFGDKPAPIIGRIAMQEISISLKGLPEVEVGSVARLPARRLLVNPAIERVYS